MYQRGIAARQVLAVKGWGLLVALMYIVIMVMVELNIWAECCHV